MMLSAPAGMRISNHSSTEAGTDLPDNVDQKNSHTYNWDRIRLSTPFSVAAGESSIRVQLDRHVEGRAGAALKFIELLKVKERLAMDGRS